MHRIASFVSGALFFGLVAGSFPKVNFETVKKDQAKANSFDGALRSPRVTKSTHAPMLELMSLGLKTWGLKGMNHTQKTLPDEAFRDGHVSRGGQQSHQFMGAGVRNDNPLAREPRQMNMFDARANQPTVQPLNFNLMSREVKHNLTNTLAIVGFVLLIFVGVAYLVPYCVGKGSELDETVASPAKDTKAKLSEGPLSQSSWARAYLEAEGEQKEALELLFRCNIISTEELACSVISQEHIQECTWIATHMLQHRPLEEWVALWQQAQLTFEDSVAECFNAKGVRRTSAAASSSSPVQTASMPSSANLDFVSQDANCSMRPLHS